MELDRNSSTFGRPVAGSQHGRRMALSPSPTMAPQARNLTINALAPERPQPEHLSPTRAFSTIASQSRRWRRGHRPSCRHRRDHYRHTDRHDPDISKAPDSATRGYLPRSHSFVSLGEQPSPGCLARSKPRTAAKPLSEASPKVYGDKQTIDGKFTVEWAQVAQEAAEKWKKKHGG
jgi:hypothetical protein